MTRILDITDGTCNTLLLGERLSVDPCYNVFQTGGQSSWAGIAGSASASAVAQVNFQIPTPCPTGAALTAAEIIRTASFGSGHGTGANFAFADGSVRWIDQS